MNTLEEWTAAVCADLGLEPASADITTVLDLARDAAHGVARPAAPLTTYQVGVAVGRGITQPDAAGRISALAADWGNPDTPGDSPRPSPSRLPDSYSFCYRPVAKGWSRVRRSRGADRRTSEGWAMTAGSDGIGGPGKSRPTRRGVLLGASLAGLGGALAGCSTAAVPYGANEAGVVEQDTPAASGTSSSGAMPGSGGGMQASPPASPSARPSASGTKGSEPKKGSTAPEVSGTVLGTASEIPVGGGKIFAAAKVVVTQPVRGQYKGFSAVCTHVGCILSEVADGTIDCPCHGSEFKITNGAVVTGPAPSPLPTKQIKIEDGQVFLI